MFVAFLRHRPHVPTRHALFYGFVLILIFSFMLIPRSTIQAAGTVTGIVFRDYNENGVQDAGEPGVGGVTVTAYGAAGTALTSTLSTAPNGTYSISWGGADTRVRIEFSDLPGTAEAGAFGSGSATSVQFADAGATNVNYGINRPVDYSQSIGNVDLVTSAYNAGAQNTGNFTVVSFGYNQTTGSPTTLATDTEVGPVWGLAYRRPTSTSPGVIYASAFAKRQAAYGPDGPGAIYAIESGIATLLTTIPNAGSTSHDSGDLLRDTPFYDAPGKEGLGDLDLSEDQTTLYVINLNDRHLYSVDIANPATPSDLGIIGNPTCTNGVYRPFGLGIRDGLVYVGGVCTGESDPLGTVGDLSAYVFSYDPATTAVNQVLSIPLNYTRTCADRDGGGAYTTSGSAVVCDIPASSEGGLGSLAEWQPWHSTWPSPEISVANGGSGTGYAVNLAANSDWFAYPQAMLTGIEFDGDDMIVTLRDRMGDQWGFQDASPNTAGYPGFGTNTLVSVITAGDILRASPSGGGWVIENNSQGSDFGPSAGQNNGEGPGGGEFYWGDNRAVNVNDTIHDEVISGGVVQIAGQPNVAANVMDAIDFYQSGTRRFSDTDGSQVSNFEVRDTNLNTFFGKANGLGDLVPLLENPPIEIGNYVWLDTNNDGIQGPDETPLAGIQVDLVDLGGNAIASATTAADGHYIFSSDTTRSSTTSEIYSVPFDFSTQYAVRINLDTGVNATLAGLNLSPANAGSGANTVRDSNGVLVPVGLDQYSVGTFTTGLAGQNDHTIDFGFSAARATATPTPVTTTTATPPPGSTPTTPGQPTISKIADPPFAVPGDTVRWIIAVSNPNSQALTNVSFTDPVPAQLEITGTQIDPNRGTVVVNGQTVSYSVGTLNPNETINVTIITRIRPDTTAPFTITNVASLTGDGNATGTVMSPVTLPSTGEEPWWRTPALLALVVIVGVGASAGGLLIRKRLIKPNG